MKNNLIIKLMDSLEEALGLAFPDLVINRRNITKEKTWSVMKRPKFCSRLNFEIDLKPRKNVWSMPVFPRILYFGSLEVCGDSIRFKFCAGQLFAYEHELSDPDSIDKIFTVMYWYYADIKDTLRDKTIEMLSVGEEPSDMELKAESLRRFALRKNLQLMKLNIP